MRAEFFVYATCPAQQSVAILKNAVQYAEGSLPQEHLPPGTFSGFQGPRGAVSRGWKHLLPQQSLLAKPARQPHCPGTQATSPAAIMHCDITGRYGSKNRKARQEPSGRHTGSGWKLEPGWGVAGWEQPHRGAGCTPIQAVPGSLTRS